MIRWCQELFQEFFALPIGSVLSCRPGGMLHLFPLTQRPLCPGFELQTEKKQIFPGHFLRNDSTLLSALIILWGYFLSMGCIGLCWGSLWVCRSRLNLGPGIEPFVGRLAVLIGIVWTSEGCWIFWGWPECSYTEAFPGSHQEWFFYDGDHCNHSLGKWNKIQPI